MAIRGTYPMPYPFFDAGRRLRRDALPRQIAASIALIMQGLGQFLLYGKLIAALRLGPAPSSNRLPPDTTTAWAHRLAAELGRLPA
ncbi:MAG: hypothetical protein WEB63_10510 [Cucumibacter sp.]